MFSYDDIAIFTAVVETGSFIAAAKKLRLPSSTVSRRLAKLEQDLGTQLLERTSRRMHLTERGRNLYEQCAHHVKSLQDLALDLQASQNTIEGSLRIAAPTLLGSEVLSEWLGEFLAAHPRVSLQVTLSNRYEDLLDEDIDVAIRIGPLEDSRFVARYLHTPEFALCASKHYTFTAGAITTPQDLHHHHLITLNYQGNRWQFRNKKTGIVTTVTAEGRLSSNDIAMARKVISSGMGIGVLPVLSAVPLLASGDVVTLLDDHEIVHQREIYAVYPSRRFLPRKTRALVDFLMKRFATLPG